MAEFQEFSIKLPHGKVSALAWGPEDGKPIIALHGWLDNAASFIPLANLLPEFRLIAIDLPGHGLSDHVPVGSYLHLVDYVGHIAHVMDALGLDKAAILGHSLGAGIGAMAAGILNDRITALGLIDGIGIFTTAAEEQPVLMRNSINEYMQIHNKRLPVYKTKEEAAKARLKVNKMNSESVNLLLERGLKNYDAGFTWRTDPRLMIAPLSMLTEAQVTAMLKHIKCPTVFIRPEAGWPFDKELINQRITHVKNIKVFDVPGAHHVHMDQPEPIAEILKKLYK